MLAAWLGMSYAWEGANWIRLVQHSDLWLGVKTAEGLRVPYMARNRHTFNGWKSGSVSKTMQFRGFYLVNYVDSVRESISMYFLASSAWNSGWKGCWNGRASRRHFTYLRIRGGLNAFLKLQFVSIAHVWLILYEMRLLSKMVQWRRDRNGGVG